VTAGVSRIRGAECSFRPVGTDCDKLPLFEDHDRLSGLKRGFPRRLTDLG
jgi:hypothetical protein